MIESVNSGLSYKSLKESEKIKRHILGTLSGPCADVSNPTRNGRYYNEDLWEKVYESPLVKEQFKSGGIFGELNHPDYDEVNLEKVAVCMPEPPKKDKNGLLIGYWHILDTPCGKVLKTLADYGYKMGISTRGNGDTMKDANGNEVVDPDTYQLNAIDIVLIPAVEAARLTLVEGLNNKVKKPLRESLNNLINESSKEDGEVMKEVLEGLNITIASDDLDKDINVEIPDNASEKDDVKVEVEEAQEEQNDEGEIPEDSEGNKESEDDINDDEEESVDDVKEALTRDLTEALNEKQEYKLKVEALNNSLSVSYTKETELKEENEKLKATIQNLVESNKKLKGQKARADKFETDSKKMNESYNKVNSLFKIAQLTNHNLTEAADHSNSLISDTQKRLDEATQQLGEKTKLCESLTLKLRTMNRENNSLSEKLEESIKEKDKQTQLNISAYKRIQSLKESVSTKENDLNKKDEDLKQIDTYREKLTESIKETATLKNKMDQFVEAYSRSICGKYGVSYSQIEDKVKDSTPEEIKDLCESLSTNNMRMKALPFATQIKGIKYTAPLTTEEKNSIEDTEVDKDLEALFNNYSDHRF